MKLKTSDKTSQKNAKLGEYCVETIRNNNTLSVYEKSDYMMETEVSLSKWRKRTRFQKLNICEIMRGIKLQVL